MEKSKITAQDELFATLMEDALIISEEIKDLQYYLELDAKTPTITEYQVFKTLYLKRKVESCLEKITLVSVESELACTHTLMTSSLAQFEGLKQIIDTLDQVNRSRQITLSYTKEEAQYIKACEEKKEKDNPQIKQYPIQTRLTFTLRKTREERPKAIQKKYKRDKVMNRIMALFFFLVSIKLIYDGQFIGAFVGLMMGLAFAIGLSESGGYKSPEEIFSLAQINLPKAEIEELNLGIRDLKTACTRYAKVLKPNKTHLQNKEDIKALGRYLGKINKGFQVYDDYETYIDILLLCEKFNPILVERGIILPSPVEETPRRKNKKRGVIVFEARLPKARSKSGVSKTREEIESYRKVKQTRLKSNQTYTKNRGQQYTSTKAQYGKGRRGR